jgi:hypothetical protein
LTCQCLTGGSLRRLLAKKKLKLVSGVMLANA